MFNSKEKKCGLCGKTKNLIRTECCNNWICDDEHKYVLFSYANNSCSRNHSRYTLCSYHHGEGHSGKWQDCKVSQAVTQLESLPVFSIPWGHNVVLMHKLKKQDDRFWYAQKTIENGWSRSMLEVWIKSNLHIRQGKAITNFSKTLPVPDSDIVQQTLKDPYVFDFLTLHSQHIESDLEHGLVDHIQKFLLELGEGFAFIGRQYHLEVDEKDYYIDLLFYHAKLHCYVVIEIKAREFDPRDAGQISFYLSAIDDNLKQPDDKPTIGLLLCKSKRKLTVEYALRKNLNPIGVASYETKLVESLPKEFKGILPTIQEIEAELEKQDFLSGKNVRSFKRKRSTKN